MPTPAERQALLFVAAVAALGLGVRAWKALDSGGPDPGARKALAAQISRVDSALAAGGPRSRRADTAPSPTAKRTRRRPTAPNSEGAAAPPATPQPPITAPAVVAHPAAGPVEQAPIDVDLASAEELDRLPGIGPALAARIVEDRERRGPFGSLEALERVRGIGPALAGRLRPHVTFSLSPRPPDTEAPAPRRGRRP